MKRTLLRCVLSFTSGNTVAALFFLIGFSYSGFAQQTIQGTITHDAMQREYILYVPSSYDGNTSVPVVLNFHGYGGNAAGQMANGDFRPFADTHGFLIVHPQGTRFNGITHWNVGGWTLGSSTNDVGFIDALLDTLSRDYNINPERMYSTGMSNGGYMSFLLACQLSERIAAIASVTGSMTPEIYDQCNPQRPVPILQMHGTADGTVPYQGANWSKSIEDVLQYWVTVNQCSTTGSTTALPDLDVSDGSTVEHIVHHGGDRGVTVEHFKVTGGGHTWPGSTRKNANQDIGASVEIWAFFSRYDIHGLIETTAAHTFEEAVPRVILLEQNYPNPFNPTTTIRFGIPTQGNVRLRIFDIFGREVVVLVDELQLAGTHVLEFDGTNHPSSTYIYQLDWNGTMVSRTMLLLK